MPISRLVLTLAAMALATPAAAQDRDHRSDRGSDRHRDSQGIPPGHLPPPGECRVWHDSRPPGQQPAPTSCAAAREQAARNGGRVIYGGDGRKRDDRDRDDRKGRDCDSRDRARGECDRDDRDDRKREDRDDRDERDDRKRDDRDRDKDCVDRDRDRRCDYDARDYPSTLPEMVWGVIFGRGERTDDVRRWIGPEALQVRYVDVDRNGKPEIVRWYRGDQLVQQWADTNRDGRADRVSLYEGGKVVRVIQ